MVSSFEETLPKENYRGEDGAARYAVDTAKGKALDVYRMTSKAEVTPDLVIGADTVSHWCLLKRNCQIGHQA